MERAVVRIWQGLSRLGQAAFCFLFYGKTSFGRTTITKMSGRNIKKYLSLNKVKVNVCLDFFERIERRIKKAY